MSRFPPASAALPAGRRRCVALIAAALMLPGCQKRPSAATFASMDLTGADYGRDFRLQDADGNPRSLADFRGKVVMLFFGFTQCPDACPTALLRAAEVRRLLGPPLAERVQVIFVTIDPERDTGPVMKQYTQAFDPGFLGLRTDLPGTAAVAGEFRAHYQKVSTGDSYTMDHTTITYVMDPQGRLRLAMRHDLSAQDAARDIRTLLEQAG
jgi:protein SCO1/2